MANNRGGKKRTRRHPGTDGQKPKKMPSEQRHPVETTRRRKETNETAEIAHTKGKEEEMQTETTRICHRDKHHTLNGKRTTRPEHIHPKSGLEERGANAARHNQDPHQGRDTHRYSSTITYNAR